MLTGMTSTTTVSTDFETILQAKPLIAAGELRADSKLATKTKAIRAKPLAQILVDNTVAEKFLLDTIEGLQVLKAGSMVCIGIGNDAWQQSQKNLFKKYRVTAIDDNGWMTCEPLPDNEVLAIQITEDMCGPEGFSLMAQWGEERMVGGAQMFIQYGKAGDYLLQRTDDPTDVWIVAKKMFESTYAFK